jgi:typhoid toxin secretion A
MTLKEKMINDIITIEGGYVNDPLDSGGATNYGITEKVARNHGYTDDMESLPQTLAFSIYETLYWDAVCADDLVLISEALAYEVVDTAVNMGVHRASTFLQRWLNVLNRSQELYIDLTVDGKMGNKTIAALKAYVQSGRKVDVLTTGLNCSQGAFYLSLAESREKDEKFIYGWIEKRCDRRV